MLRLSGRKPRRTHRGDHGNGAARSAGASDFFQSIDRPAGPTIAFAKQWRASKADRNRAGRLSIATGSRGPQALTRRGSRARRIAFFVLAAVLALAFGIGFFGLTVLVIGWFEKPFGVSTPVSELSHGALAGIIVTIGLLTQLRSPERRIAGLQQAVLGILALMVTALIGGRQEPLQESLLFLAALSLLVILHPVREQFFKRGAGPTAFLAFVAIICAIPAAIYAAFMLVPARGFIWSPHHADRFAEMAAAAIALVAGGVAPPLAKTPGWGLGTACPAA